jgi:NADH-quinone oxidoreductase subunit L
MDRVETRIQRLDGAVVALSGGVDSSLLLALAARALPVAKLVAVTAVSLCVHVYSIGYMHGDLRFTWFYVVLSMFTAAMLNVVIADNLFQLLIGWEVMGVCSYLLIGHWWEEHVNSSSAIKAFITTRIGDVPFMFGIFVLIAATGFTTSNIQEIGHLVGGGEMARGVVSIAALLLFGGAIGKSAQFPLHVWLPDAMAGPTPVSALIHAATMVAAGVYMVGRTYEVFVNADPWVLQFVGVIGVITAVGAGLLGLVQDDIKRVLAYSTVSQLGYMVTLMSAGPAGRNAAFFHLFTHAFFKALLFLGSGTVIHACHTNNMSEMGGLKKSMPITFWTFLIGSLALAGIPPLAGFFSKDELLVALEHNHQIVLFLLLLVSAAVTAFYTARMVIQTFLGDYRGHGHHTSRRSR